MSAETVADVVAWMRGYAGGFNLYLRTGMTFRDWLLLCDRLDAAAKHDAKILTDGETGGGSHRSRNGEREACARA